MKNSFYNNYKLTLLFFLINSPLIAEKIPGYYITRYGDTIETIIKVPLKTSFNQLPGADYQEPNVSGLNRSVTYYDKAGKKYILYPGQAKEFGFTYKNTDYTFLSRKDEFNNCIGVDSVFLRLQKNGHVKMFDCIVKKEVSYKGSIYMYEEQYILQKGDGELFQAAPSHFAAQMSEYFSDYPDLAEKIASRRYKMSDVYSIVDIYNSWKAIEERNKTNVK